MATARQRLEVLSACPLFEGMQPGHLRSLAADAQEQSLGRREHLFHEGSAGRAVFLLLDGSVQLYKLAPDGREVVIRTLDPGEMFGEVVLFERADYPVSAVALAPSRLLALPVASFRKRLDDAAFRSDFLARVMGRLRYLANRILYLTSCDVEERFFQFLEEHYGKREVYRLSLSNRDLAAAIGTTPETLSRLKERLVREGRVRWQGRECRVLK